MSKMFAFEFIQFDNSRIDEADEGIVRTTYTFDFIGGDEDIQALYDKSMNGFEYDDWVSEVESDFGLHDFFGTEKVLYGFSSDEVQPDQYDRLIDHWKHYFVKNGFQVGETTIHKGIAMDDLIG
jgi:hypothetical protein